MTSAIVLPTLSQWAEQHITALFNATDDTFKAAWDAFFTKDVKLTVNGKHISGADYQKQLSDRKALEAGAQVTFTGAVEVPDNANKPFDSGNVGLFLQATVEEKFLVLGAPESSTVTASFNITIIQDPTLKPPPQGPIRGDFDGRRVSVLNEVSVDKRNPIEPINPGGPILPA